MATRRLISPAFAAARRARRPRAPARRRATRPRASRPRAPRRRAGRFRARPSGAARRGLRRASSISRPSCARPREGRGRRPLGQPRAQRLAAAAALEPVAPVAALEPVEDPALAAAPAALGAARPPPRAPGGARRAQPTSSAIPVPSRAETRITGRFQPASVGLAEPDAALQLRRRGAGWRAEIGLVHDEDVGRLQHAGLHELEPVAGAGVRDIDERIHQRGRLDLGLAHAHRLDEDAVEGRAEDHDRGAGRLREASQAIARRHRAQEDARVGGGRAHADPVAEQRPAAPAGWTGSTATIASRSPRGRS